MSYWFEIDKGFGGTMLMRTHHGKWSRQTIHQINGQDITRLEWDQVQAILDNLRDTRSAIEFLLSSWEGLTFTPDSAPYGWNTQRIVENA
jgi:hypothetical protein